MDAIEAKQAPTTSSIIQPLVVERNMRGSMFLVWNRLRLVGQLGVKNKDSPESGVAIAKRT